jgi:hypothetical protein
MKEQVALKREIGIDSKTAYVDFISTLDQKQH